MSITVEKIYYTAMRKYNMKLIAGNNGIWNQVSWLHILEERDNAVFLNGEELVLVTGIGLKEENDLFKFVQKVHESGASGIVINVGPYIETVPDDVLEYANANNIPIFTVPWEVKLVDLTREFGSTIIKGEEEEKSMCAAFRGVILYPNDEKNYMPFFQQYPNLLKKKYCIIKCLPISLNDKENSDMTKLFYELRRAFERVVNKVREEYVIFRYDNYMSVIIPDTNRKECDQVIKEFLACKSILTQKAELYFSVSRYDLKVKELHSVFESLAFMCKLSQKDSRYVWHWEELGVWDMIFAVGDIKKLSEFRKTNIGELERYDKENGTDYCSILDVYLRQNGNMPEAAAECYLHRNTFAYHLKKIAEMIGCDIYSTSDRVRLFMALRVRELLDLA